MFPAYPAFRQIAITDQAVFNQAFQLHPPQISEFTFTNLYAWRKAYDFQVSQFQEVIIISFRQDGAAGFLNPVGSTEPASAIAAILEQSKGEFARLPQETKELCEKNPRLAIKPDRDNADYLYLTADLIALKGGKYDAKRNFIKRFKSRYRYEYLKLGPGNIKECLDFAGVWCSAKNCDNIKGLSDERRAFEEMLVNFAAFNLLGAAIKVEGRIVGLALAEKLNPRTLVMHILKASPEIGGLYPALLNEFLVKEGAGFQYLNMEQDLGVPGLRKSKLSYQSCQLMMKYTVGLK